MNEPQTSEQEPQVVEPSPSTSDSSDPTNPSLLPPINLSPSLPGAKDFHQRQAARLADTLRRVAQDPSDLLGQSDQQDPEDPKERVARLEKEGQKVLKDLQEARVDVVRVDLLALLAQLDLPALLAIQQILTTRNWLSKLRSTSGLKLNSSTTEEK